MATTTIAPVDITPELMDELVALDTPALLSRIEGDPALEEGLFVRTRLWEHRILLKRLSDLDKGKLPARAECNLDVICPLAQNPTTPVGSLFSVKPSYYTYFNSEKTPADFQVILDAITSADYGTPASRATLANLIVENIPLDMDYTLGSATRLVVEKLLASMDSNEIQAIPHLVEAFNFINVLFMLNQESDWTTFLVKDPHQTFAICEKVRPFGGGFICKYAQDQADIRYPEYM